MTTLKLPCADPEGCKHFKREHQLQAELKRYEGAEKRHEEHCIAMGKVVDKLQAELEKYRWIPVSERLPKKTSEYLVLPYRQHCPVLWYQDGWYWYSHQDDAINDTIGYCEEPIFEVTHWKPIISHEQALKIKQKRKKEE